MAGELPEDIKATLSILDSQTPPPPAKLKTTRTMEDIALPTKRQPAGGDDVSQTLAILDGKEPEPVATAGEPDPRDIEVDVLKLALRKGINSNTALAAHRQSVARKLNISPALVTPQAEESAFYQDHDPEELHKNYPALAKYLKVEGNAELVGKNIEPMKEIEVFFRRAVQDPEIVAAKGVVGAVQTLVGLGNLVSAGKAGKYVEEHGIDLKKIQSVLNDLYTPETQKALEQVSRAEGFFGTIEAALKNPSSIGVFTVESLPQMYLGRVFGSGLKAAFPGLSFGAAGAAGEGITMAGGSAEQIRSATEDGELTAGQAALSVGVGVAGTALSAFGAKLATKLGIEDVDAALVAGKLLSRLEDSGVPKQLAVRLVGGAAVEGAVEEMPQSVVEQIAQNVALGRSWDEGVPESAAIGLVTGGAMGAAVQVGAVRGKQSTVTETPAEKQARTTVQNSIMKTTAAVNAEEQRNAIKEWGQRVASNNPLRKEAPDSFKEFVSTMAEEDGALKEVYVDGKLLRESFAQAGIDGDKLKSTMPEVAESLGEALATNGEARIPIEDYAAHIVGTPVEQAILDHLRTTPEGMTYAEAQVYFQEQQDDFIKQAEALVSLNEPVLSRKEFEAQAPEGVKYKDYLAAHKNKVEVFARDLETVHDKLLEGLDSTGRFPKSITRVYAIPFREFYATNAARMGVLPTELYDSLPLNFQQMSVGDMLDQRAFHGSPHSFDKFSSEKIGAGEGAQAYGYGLYFTDTKAVAEHYRQAHKNNKLVLPSGADLNEAAVGTEERFAQTLLKANSGDYAKSLTENKVEENASAGDKRFTKAVEKILKDYKKRGVKAVSLSGGIYEVELAPEQDEYLLWDKPLSEQSEKVKAALEEYYKTESSVEYLNAVKEYDNGNTRAIKDAGFNVLDYPGAAGGMYEREAGFDGARKVSRVFHRYGIRGIKYLDQGSRQGGEGTYNYVIFDDRDVAITQVYAQSANIPETINIDGTDRPTRNSEGKLIHPTEDGIRNFWKWFGDSKIVDEQGRSLVVYHGTNNDVSEFIEEFLGKATKARSTELGFYFTNNPHLSHKFANKKGANIMSVYLRIENPLELDSVKDLNKRKDSFETLRNAIIHVAGKETWRDVTAADVKNWRDRIISRGYDGIILRNTEMDGAGTALTLDNPYNDFYIVFNPNQIKSAIGNTGEFSDDPNILKQSAFYSALQREIPSISKIADKNGMVKTDQAIAWVEARQKEGKFKLEEVEAVGLKDWLQATEGKVSVTDIDTFVRENGVQVETKFLSEGLEIDEDRVFDEAYQEFVETNPQEDEESDEDYQERWESHEDYYRTLARERIMNELQGKQVKFAQYTLPGASGAYQEMLLTLPEEKGRLYRSGHFDDANILAHVRFNERVVEGKPKRTRTPLKEKILFIEEIQSDWAQEGRKKGFAKETEQYQLAYKDGPGFGAPYADEASARAELQETFAGRDDVEVRKIGSRLIGVPTAPFVQNTKSWVTLAVKRVLRYAAENGYSKIAWTNGAQQAARYDLSKQISEIRYSNGYLKAYDLDNKLVLNKSSVTEEELPDIIGKEAAQRLLEQPKEGEGKMQVLSGLDLKVGGEGMVAFYDKLLPQVVNDVAKKLGGGKVGSVGKQETFEDFIGGQGLFLKPGDSKLYRIRAPESFVEHLTETEAREKYRQHIEALGKAGEQTFSEQPALEITPEMREKILSGLPLFQGNRAGFDPSTFTISLLKGADLSSVIHEGAHFYLEALADLAGRDNAPQQIKDDFRTTLNWFGITGNEEGMQGGATLAQSANIPETIDIDGTDRPTRNSEGKVIHPTEEGIRNFWKWFGNSDAKVRRNPTLNGRPSVMYHTTKGDFNTFEVGRKGTNSNTFGSWETFRSGIFVAPEVTDSELYGMVGPDSGYVTGANVLPVYVRAEKPLDLFGGLSEVDATLLEEAGLSPSFLYSRQFGHWEMFDDEQGQDTVAAIKRAGYDSVIYSDENPDTGEPFESWVVFSPDQIKSAIGNNGDFSNDPNILKQGGETPPPGQLPSGKTPEEIWRSMTLDQKRRYHEQWAQSYERYTMEGKAPTVEMQSVFSRFREWMLSVYKSMKDFLAQNPLAGKLNDDIRAVFDRLIASEDKIYQAEEARGYSALFGSAAEAGLSEKEFEDYQNLGKLASLRAVDEMNGRSIRDMRWLSNAKDKAIKKLQAEANTKRAAIKAQVTDEVDSMPLNRARNFLAKGEFIDENGVRRESDTKFKLNPEEVKALSNGQVPANLENMVAPDGIGLELAAKLLGYQNPEALLNDLVNGESRDVTIQGLTDQRMLEQYGDLIDDKAIERAAEKAIHNEARAKFMATGLKILARTELSATQLNRAAKLAAEATIAKKKIRALTPGQFTRAEAKANREAIESVAKDPRKAVEAQRAALLNNRLAKAALEASEEVDSILKYFKKFESQGVRKAVGIDQIDQIDDLLQTVDRDKNLPLREIDKRQALAEWVAEQEADGFEPVLDPILAEQIKAKHYKEMTVDELRMLRDTVKQIEHVGRLKQTLLTEMRRADFRERVEEAEASIRDNANRTVKERGTPTDVAGITGQWVRQMIASHRKFSSYMREMDGGNDGGVMWRLLSKNMNAAGDQEIEMRRASGEAIAELFKGFKQEKAPLNLYAKRTRIPGTEIFMTQEQRIMFGMNWGNEGNRQRLLDGGITGKRALSITEAQAILDTLTKEEWDFIQGTWDHIATYKDQIAALERKLTGIEPEWIEPAEIKTKYGTYRGGYFPAKYDVELSSRSESLEAAVDLRMGMKGAFNTAATRNGYTKQRSEAVMNRPLLLSYNVIANHISEVTHRLAWQPWLIDANRILKALDAPIREHYGAEVLRELRNTVIDIAAGDVGARTPMERAINHLRTGSTIVGMGWRFSTAFLQPSGLAQSWARIGGRWMAKGIAESLKNPNKAGEFVNARSSLMKNRDITMNREVREVLDRIRTTEGVNAVTGSYFSLIAKMQRMVDIPTWMGAYEKALHDLKYEDAADAEQRAQIENDAVALADQAVVDSQSGGQIKDLASIQRGHPGLKLFTNFYSYFSATYNLNIEALRRTNFRSPTDVAFLASDLVLLNVLPVIFAVALKEMTKGKCGDDLECLAASYGYEQMGFMFGQMVLLRDAGSAALVAAGGDQFGYSGPAGLRFFSDLYKAGVQANQGELDWPLFKSVSNTAGVLLHFPTGQINTTLEGIIAVENGDVDGVSILPALLFGPPKE